MGSASSTVTAAQPRPGIDITEQYWGMIRNMFPNIVKQEEYIARVSHTLGMHGFDKENSIVLVNVCRDEITRPFIDAMDDVWGSTFNISSLAGSITCGKTGFTTAFQHAPQRDGKEKYVIVAAPHIGVAGNGEVGVVERGCNRSREIACEALHAFHEEMQQRHIHLEMDSSDLEQSILKQTLLRDINYGAVPSLLELTEIAHSSIVRQIEAIMRALKLPTHACDYAILTGIQVHGPDHLDLFQPRTMYAVVDGVVVNLEQTYKICDYDTVKASQKAAMALRLNRYVQRSDVTHIQRWIDRRKPINIADPDGITPLHVAASIGSEALVTQLLRYGSNPSARNCYGQIPADLTTSSRLRYLLTCAKVIAK